MRQMGFVTVVPDAAASPIVATFHNPVNPKVSFDALFQGMQRRGFVIFPGRLALVHQVKATIAALQVRLRPIMAAVVVGVLVQLAGMVLVALVETVALDQLRLLPR